MRSTIRESLVTIMLAQTAQQVHDFESSVGGSGQPVADHRLGLAGNGESAALGSVGFVGQQPPNAPSTCVFWCAVALGGLVQGQPPSSVSCWHTWHDLLVDMGVRSAYS